MKVLLVATQIDELGGGAAAAVRHLADGLKGQDVEVVLAGSQREAGMVQTDVNGIPAYLFRPRNLYWIGDKDTRATYEKAIFQMVDLWNPHVHSLVSRIIDRERPDIVHVHKMRGLSPSVWAAAARARLPVVHTCHDYEVLSPEGTIAGRMGELAISGSPLLWPYQSMRRALSRSVSVVTAPTRFTLDHHLRLGFFAHARSFVVPNTHGLTEADLKARRITPAASEGRATRLLYLGRLEEEKGAAVLCAAYEKAVAARPELRLDVAGWGALEQPLRARYGHLPHLVFHGRVAGAAKEELLANTDVMIVPSTCWEVFGIVIVEAFAHGKPVIASALGSLPELVDEGRTGFLTPPGDVEALAERLIWAADHSAALQAMSPACAAAARAYTVEASTRGYLAAYAAVLAVGSVPPAAQPATRHG